MKIDLHCHAFPAKYLQKLAAYYPDFIELKEDAQGGLSAVFNNAPCPAWDHSQRLLDIDRAGVDMEVLSNPFMYMRVDDRSPEICRLVNDALAESCQRDPARFKAFAHIPFNNMDAALGELARALDELEFVGVIVASNIAGRYLDAPEFDPFWEEVNRRKVTVFMHPAAPPNYQDEMPAPFLAFPYDTTLSTTKLIYNGLLERYADITLILSHLGGAIPYLARRIDLVFDEPARRAKYTRISRRPSEYMKALYLDTAMCWGGPAFDCARELVGIDHIVYGTDYFMIGSKFMDWTNDFLESLELSAEDREKVYCRNAQRILHL